MTISISDYKKALRSVLNDKEIQILKQIYDSPKSTITPLDLSKIIKPGSSDVIIANNRVGNIGKKIAKHIKLGKKKDWWEVIGPLTESRWIMNKNLRIAMEELGISKRSSTIASRNFIPNSTNKSYYIIYHNADNLKTYPNCNVKFETPINQIVLDNRYQNIEWAHTKKGVNNAIGAKCFLIVGKTENKIKKYYLWSRFGIDGVNKLGPENHLRGTGFNFKKPILLNELKKFNDFKGYVQNFRNGLQKIDGHVFLQTLIRLSLENESNETHINKNSRSLIKELNEKMKKVKPEKREAFIQKLIRNDRQIVDALKKHAGYKCQFPGCKAVIRTLSGENYVEVAHIEPVKKGGQSIIGNLLVLCPNHHKEFDLGERKDFAQTNSLITGFLNGRFFRIKTL